MNRLVVLSLVVATMLPARSAGDDEIDYDIFRRNDSVVVCLNLAPLLSPGRVEKIRDGLAFAFDYRLTLVRPRRLWGAEAIAQSTGLIEISYQVITENYVVSGCGPDSLAETSFTSLAVLREFLRDSVVSNLAAIAGLNHESNYALQLSIECIALTDINLAAGGGARARSESPIKFLFKQFLQLTGYGRVKYSLTTRPFSLSELAAED